MVKREPVALPAGSGVFENGEAIGIRTVRQKPGKTSTLESWNVKTVLTPRDFQVTYSPVY